MSSNTIKNYFKIALTFLITKYQMLILNLLKCVLIGLKYYRNAQ